MANVTIFVDVDCLECGKDDINIFDYNEMVWLCECLNCGLHFQKMRE